MRDDDIVSLGEHGSEDAFDRRELLKKSGRLAAAGALAGPLLASAGEALAASAAAVTDPIAATRGAAGEAVQGDHADDDPRDGPTSR